MPSVQNQHQTWYIMDAFVSQQSLMNFLNSKYNNFVDESIHQDKNKSYLIAKNLKLTNNNCNNSD